MRVTIARLLRHAARALVPAVCLGIAATAVAREEQPVVPGTRLFAELDPGERVEVPLDALDGQTLSIVLKPWAGSQLVADVSIEAPDGTALDVSGLLSTRSIRGGRTVVSIRRLRLVESGTYHVVIATSSGTSGGFDLTTVARPPRAKRGKAEITVAGLPATVPFEAAPGDRATIVTRGLGRPRWVPVVERLTESGAAPLELGDRRRSGPHTIEGVGGHVFEIGHADGETGRFAYTVRVRRSRPSRTRLDIVDLQAAGAVSGRILVNGDRGRTPSAKQAEPIPPAPPDGVAAEPPVELPVVLPVVLPVEPLPGMSDTQAAEFAVGEFIIHAPLTVSAPLTTGGRPLVDVLAEELPGAALEIDRSLTPGGPHLVRIPHLADRAPTPRDLARTRTILDAVRRVPGVGLCEPNFIVRSTAEVNDPRFPDQIGLAATRVKHAWDIQPDAASVVVAVLDTGKFRSHPDLESVYIAGRDFVRSNSDDGDGWDDNPEDAAQHLHGTLVAGVIGARTNNGIGVASVCRKVKILPVRVLGRYGGTFFDVAMGIRWAAGLPVMDLPLNPQPADVINLSLGGTGYSQVAADAVTDAVAAGSLVVASAGNAASQTRHYPAAFDDAIAVTAVDRNLQVASYSSFGSWVSITASGGDPAFTGRGILTTDFDLATLEPIYSEVAGTSFSSPHVAGVAALVIAANPALSPAEVREILETTTLDIGPPGFDIDFGHGLVNAEAAVRAASPTAPDAADELIVSPTTLLFRSKVQDLPVRLSNAAEGVLTILSVDAQEADPSIDWLHAVLDANTTPTQLVVSVDQDELGVGIFRGTVSVHWDGGVEEIDVLVTRADSQIIDMVFVTAQTESGVLIERMATSAASNWEYSFENLPLGSYRIAGTVDYDANFKANRVDEFYGIWPLPTDAETIVLDRQNTEREDVDFALQPLGLQFQFDGVSGGSIDDAVAVRVLDENTGRPIEGADVIVAGRLFESATDERGRAVLTGTFGSEPNVTIVADGYVMRSHMGINAQYQGFRLEPLVPSVDTVSVEIQGLATFDTEAVVQIGSVRQEWSLGDVTTAVISMDVPPAEGDTPVFVLIRDEIGTANRFASGIVDLSAESPAVTLVAAIPPALSNTMTKRFFAEDDFAAEGAVAHAVVEARSETGIWYPLGISTGPLDESLTIRWLSPEIATQAVARLLISIQDPNGRYSTEVLNGTLRRIDLPTEYTLGPPPLVIGPDGGDPISAGDIIFDFFPETGSQVIELLIRDAEGAPVWTLLLPHTDGLFYVPFVPRGGLTPAETYTWSADSLHLLDYNSNHFQHVELERLEVAITNTGPLQFTTK